MVYSSGTYTYDPYVDTLVVDLQGDITVRAYFGESRDIVINIDPSVTNTSIDINGSNISVFPHTTSILIGENMTLNPNLDVLYGFVSWESDSNTIVPNTLTENISFEVVYGDTITLNLYQKATIVYDISPPGTATSININGVNVVNFPYSTNVFIDDLNTMAPTIDPNYSTGVWTCNFNTLLNGNAHNNSFYGEYE